MVSKTLVKLIDEAIIPAVALVCAKILGTILVSLYFNLNATLTKTGITFSSPDDYIKANSYSSLIMFAVIMLGLLWVVVRARSLHETHVTPTLTAKLASLRLLPLVQDTITIYSSAIVWLSYAWLTAAILVLQSAFGLSYPWVTVLSFFVVFTSTWLLIADIEREVYRGENDHRHEETVTVKERVLKFAE